MLEKNRRQCVVVRFVVMALVLSALARGVDDCQAEKDAEYAAASAACACKVAPGDTVTLAQNGLSAVIVTRKTHEDGCQTYLVAIPSIPHLSVEVEVDDIEECLIGGDEVVE
jgi:hypothetical protein